MGFTLGHKAPGRPSKLSGEQIRVEGVGHDLRRAMRLANEVKDLRIMEVRAAIARAVEAHDSLVEEMYG